MYDLLEKLEALIEDWENTPYTGDYIKATRGVCAQELRQVIGQPTTKFLDAFSARELEEAFDERNAEAL